MPFPWSVGYFKISPTPFSPVLLIGVFFTREKPEGQAHIISGLAAHHLSAMPLFITQDRYGRDVIFQTVIKVVSKF